MDFCIDHKMYVYVFLAYGLGCNPMFWFEKKKTPDIWTDQRSLHN